MYGPDYDNNIIGTDSDGSEKGRDDGSFYQFEESL